MTPNVVVMASDSALTIGDFKTYVGVNKVFELSDNPPMGIMIYNNADFLNIPIETLIKDFKKKYKINSMNEFCEKFKKYLTNEPKKNSLVKISLEEKFKDFKYETKLFFKNVNINKFLNKNETSNNFNKYKNIIFKNNNELNNFKNKMKKFSNQIKKDNKLYNYLLDAFIDFILNNYTGISIVGFEKEKLLPSAFSFKIIYLYDDEFIFENIWKDEINNKNNVIVKPFAQIDVIESFLNGFDSETENLIKNYFKNAFKDYNNKLIELINNNNEINIKNKKYLYNLLKNNIEQQETYNAYNEIIDIIKENNNFPIFSLISVLPKNELSDLAESLINITSLKRKIQKGLDSVGGDIDVAIITKNEGFKWSKGKHCKN